MEMNFRREEGVIKDHTKIRKSETFVMVTTRCETKGLQERVMFEVMLNKL